MTSYTPVAWRRGRTHIYDAHRCVLTFNPSDDGRHLYPSPFIPLILHQSQAHWPFLKHTHTPKTHNVTGSLNASICLPHAGSYISAPVLSELWTNTGSVFTWIHSELTGTWTQRLGGLDHRHCLNLRSEGSIFIFASGYNKNVEKWKHTCPSSGFLLFSFPILTGNRE